MESISQLANGELSFTILPLIPQQLLLEASNGVSKLWTEKSYLHSLWIFPLSILVNAAASILMPICALISLIATGVFKLMNSCTFSSEAHNDYTVNLLGTLLAATLIPVVLGRIFYPALDENICGA